MKSFSIYRGLSQHGIGEGPGHPPVPHGEQYLAADPPMNEDGELLSAARPWMTPDWRTADEQALGDRIEAWSCFSHRDLRVVVRIIAAGTYDRRAAYFAHGRAFPASEFAGGNDPGAYLGHSGAFEPRWRDGQDPRSPLPLALELARPAQILEEPAMACSLLAHLYHGLLAGSPVVLAVPVSDFAAGSLVHASVSFARAALPLELKLDCRIRVFTRLSELFLRHLQANLIVVPEDEAGNALAARRDATLLDRKGIRRVGRELAREAGEYAEAVLSRFTKLPGGLLAFSGAIGEFLPTGRLPGEPELVRVSPVYLALGLRNDPAKLGEWIKSRLVQQVAEQPTGLPWDRLIRPEDWRALTFADLVDISLANGSGEEAKTLVRLADAEARRPDRMEIVTEERLQDLWDARPEERRPELLTRLLGGPETGRSLVAAEAAARLSSRLPLRQILDAGCEAPLLAAELEAGVLGRRAEELADLATAAGRDSRVAAVLGRATSGGSLSAGWAVRLLETADETTAVTNAAQILPAAVASLAWRPLLSEIYERLLRFATLPRELAAPLAEALHSSDPFDPAAGCHDFLVLTELVARTASPQGNSAVERAWETAARLAEPEERREFLERVADPGWQSLRPEGLISKTGRLTLPWAEGFADLLLEKEVLRDVLATSDVVRLGGGRRELGPWLDPRMASDPESTTAELLRSGQWSCWRSGSALAGDQLRKSALAWLASYVWRQRSAPQALLEDWKQVVADLASSITGGELRDLLPGSPGGPRWPWITPFEDVQLGDLCRLAAADLGALAELADGLEPVEGLAPICNGNLFEHVLQEASPSICAKLPANALSFLSASRRAATAEPLPPLPAGLLFEHTRHRRDRAVEALRRSVERFLSEDPLAALQAAEKLAPWQDDPRLLNVIEPWHRRQKGPLGSEAQAILERNLPLKVAATVPPISTRQLEPTLAALVGGRAEEACWNRFGEELRGYAKGSFRGPHPVARLAQRLREILPRLADTERASLNRKGWNTFNALAKAHPLMLQEPLERGVPLPALEVAALLLPRLGIGGAALRLLFLEGARGHIQRVEWWNSLVAGLRCYCWNGGLRRISDREEVALALIHQAIPDLVSSSRDVLPAPEVRDVLAGWMGQLYHEQGIPFFESLIPRVIPHAGAER